MFHRQIHGRARALDLTAGGYALGSARAFFGMDSASNANRQYLTSGLQWATGALGGRPLLQVSALHTRARGAGFGGQTLIRAQSRLELGGRWYLPDISSEIDRVSDAGTNTRVFSGYAARLGLTDRLGALDYTLDYFRADAQFNALGSAMVAGDRGVEVRGGYNLGSAWRISGRLRLHQSIAADIAPRLIQRWVIQRRRRPTDIGSPWRLSARFGGGATPGHHHLPIAIQLAAKTARWHAWRLDSALGWYDSTITPLGLPIAGALWRVSASRSLNIAGLAMQWSPSFALRGSRYRDRGFASRTRLSLGFPRVTDKFNFNLDYLSTGWRPRAKRGAFRLTLRYTQNAAALWSHLSAAAHAVRVPWQRRH